MKRPAKTARRSKLKSAFPFPFIGEGFGTSYKCLEGYIWFHETPAKRDHAAILKLLPEPMRVVARVEGDLLHFGSDDALESRVKLRYSKAYQSRPPEEVFEELEELWQSGSDDYIPTKSEWKAFCDDFRACVEKLHTRWPIRIALKPDQGEYGMSLGAWHRWSMSQLLPIAAHAAAQKAKPTRGMTYFAANLIQSVLLERPPKPDEIPRWLPWLDKLAAEGDKDLRDELVGFINEMLERVPENAAELEATLRPSVRKKVAAAARG